MLRQNGENYQRLQGPEGFNKKDFIQEKPSHLKKRVPFSTTKFLWKKPVSYFISSLGRRTKGS